MLCGDAVVVTEHSCFTHSLSIVMRLPEHKLEEKGLILDHGLGGFSLFLCSLVDRGKAASLRKCGWAKPFTSWGLRSRECQSLRHSLAFKDSLLSNLLPVRRSHPQAVQLMQWWGVCLSVLLPHQIWEPFISKLEQWRHGDGKERETAEPLSSSQSLLWHGVGDLPTDPTSWSADLGVEIFNTNRSRLASWGMVSPRFCVAVAYLTVSYEVTLGCGPLQTIERRWNGSPGDWPPLAAWERPCCLWFM